MEAISVQGGSDSIDRDGTGEDRGSAEGDGSGQPFRGWTPRAVVFDCDGLLMDTEPCWTVAETEVFARRGAPFGPEQKERILGRSLEAAAEIIAEEVGEPGTGPTIQDELMELVTEVVATKADLMAGAAGLVERVRQRVPAAVASNSRRSLLDVTLARGGLSPLVPVTVAADEVAAPKPAPDVYLQACEQMGVDPTEVLAFEDSPVGLRAAMGAGIRTVGVPSSNRRLPADLVVPSLDSSELVTWVDSWRSAVSD